MSEETTIARRPLSECPKETLVDIITMLFSSLEQEYLVLPGTLALKDKLLMCIHEPSNALVYILYDVSSEHPGTGRVPLNYKPLTILALDHLKAKGCVITADGVVQ